MFHVRILICVFQLLVWWASLETAYRIPKRQVQLVRLMMVSINSSHTNDTVQYERKKKKASPSVSYPSWTVHQNVRERSKTTTKRRGSSSKLAIAYHAHPPPLTKCGLNRAVPSHLLERLGYREWSCLISLLAPPKLPQLLRRNACRSKKRRSKLGWPSSRGRRKRRRELPHARRKRRRERSARKTDIQARVQVQVGASNLLQVQLRLRRQRRRLLRSTRWLIRTNGC